MFTHLGMLTLDNTATNEQRSSIAEGLAGLVGVVDGLVSARVGLDLNLTEGSASLVFLMEFNSEDAWRAYSSHPAHKALVTERIAPILTSRASLQVDGFIEAPA